jgi:3-oxoacyl-[acyl-carrier protein] reductase
MAEARKVLITGGARGIGLAIADRFRSAGCIVFAPSRSELDLSDLSAVRDFASRERAADVDILINNAGENKPLRLDEIEPEALARILDVNVSAPFLLSRYLGVRMAERGWGRIVNISSVYSMVSREKRSMYSTSKSALNGLTRALAVELGPRGVLANAVCPGFVDTELTRLNNTPDEIAALCELVPLGRMAAVPEIAEFVYFIGSELNTYITGQTLPIDGGFLCR